MSPSTSQSISPSPKVVMIAAFATLGAGAYLGTSFFRVDGSVYADAARDPSKSLEERVPSLMIWNLLDKQTRDALPLIELASKHKDPEVCRAVYDEALSDEQRAQVKLYWAHNREIAPYNRPQSKR